LTTCCSTFTYHLIADAAVLARWYMLAMLWLTVPALARREQLASLSTCLLKVNSYRS